MRLALVRQNRMATGLTGRPVAVFPLVTLLVLACGPTESAVATHTVRDSSGIRIVENLRPAWTEKDVWRVDGEVVLDVSGQTDSDLFWPSSPWLLPDGRLALFNTGACQVRFYDVNGEFLAASGGCGAGPGEYRPAPQLMWPWRGDSLVVFDWDLRRLTFLDRHGELGRTALVPSHDDMPRPGVLGSFSDGTFVLSGQRDPGPRNPGVVEISQRSLGLVRDVDDTVRLVGIYPGPTYQYRESQGRLTRPVLPFSGSTKFAVSHDRLFMGFPDRYEIQVLRSDGKLDRIVRREFQPVHVTQADIDRLLERRLGEVEGEEAQRLIRQALRDLRHAEEMPAFGTPIWIAGREEGGPDMLADEEGNLWVFDYYRPGEYRNEFSVFSQDGVWQGTVALPERFRPSQIGRDFLVGTWTDEMGFVHIRRYRLIKP